VLGSVRTAERPGPGDRRAAPARPAAASAVGALHRAYGNRFVSALLGTQPRLQRRLLVDGPVDDVAALCALLGPPAGLALYYTPGNLRVTEADRSAEAPSESMRARLLEIMGDTSRHAEVQVGRGLAGVTVGAFPGQVKAKPPGLRGDLELPQRVDVAQVLAIERGARHAGAIQAMHEIWENYEAHGAQTVRYDPAHEAAIEVESDVAEELVGPGRRVAEAELSGVAAYDYETYFVVVESEQRGNINQVTRSARVGALTVETATTAPFAAGSAALPADTLDALAPALTVLRSRPLTTGRIEGYAAAGEADGLAKQRADAVLEAIEEESSTLAGRLHAVAGTPLAGQVPRVVVTVRQPDVDWVEY
jgi:hypothetical protein